jgi:hypothetical protein
MASVVFTGWPLSVSCIYYWLLSILSGIFSMDIPTQKLLQRLKDITRVVEQVDQGITSNIEVQRTHPERLKNLETWLKLASDEAKLIREEDEVGVMHWDEIAEALPTVIDRLNNQITIQQNIDFILATDKQVLERFIGYVLQYGMPLFEDVLYQMQADDFAKIEDVVDIVRRKKE